MSFCRAAAGDQAGRSPLTQRHLTSRLFGAYRRGSGAVPALVVALYSIRARTSGSPAAVVSTSTQGNPPSKGEKMGHQGGEGAGHHACGGEKAGPNGHADEHRGFGGRGKPRPTR